MRDKYNELFFEGLKERNTDKLLQVPKSDIHSHSTKGCRKEWLEERLNRKFSNPPARLDGLEGMQEWYTNTIKPYSSGSKGIILRWEGAFAEAKRNNIKRLAMNFGTAEIELVGGMEAFTKLINHFHEVYCTETVFEPEITYITLCDVDKEAESMDEYVSDGFFKSIDICGYENIRPMKDFLPLFSKAEKYNLVKRMHVGESGTAENVRAAVELFGLNEIHHGINAVKSKEVMNLLVKNNIQLNVCPSSNVMLGYSDSYENHPIKVLYENGVKVTINTDDLLIFNSSIENEYLLLYEAGTLSADQLNEIRLWGLNRENEFTGSK